MKKLLVFVLVFAMVSAANAALSLKIVDNLDGTFGIKSITSYELAPDDNLYFCAISNNAANYPHGGTVQPGAPAATEVLWPTDVGSVATLPAGWNGMGGFIGVVAVGSVHVDAGLYIDDITASAGDTIELYWVNGDDGSLGAQPYDVVTLVPEPMTLALLGLGGLFLRRRK